MVSSANEINTNDTKGVESESSGAIGPIIGGTAGGLIVIAGISYFAYIKIKKGGKGFKSKSNEDNEAGQTKDTINTSNLGLVDKKGFDTEAGNHYGQTKSELRADITTQNASSHLRSASPSKRSKPLNHDDIAFEVIEFDEVKSLSSFKP